VVGQAMAHARHPLQPLRSVDIMAPQPYRLRCCHARARRGSVEAARVEGEQRDVERAAQLVDAGPPSGVGRPPRQLAERSTGGGAAREAREFSGVDIRAAYVLRRAGASAGEKHGTGAGLGLMDGLEGEEVRPVIAQVVDVAAVRVLPAGRLGHERHHSGTPRQPHTRQSRGSPSKCKIGSGLWGGVGPVELVQAAGMG
jgi:hypothetical protein